VSLQHSAYSLWKSSLVQGVRTLEEGAVLGAGNPCVRGLQGRKEGTRHLAKFLPVSIIFPCGLESEMEFDLALNRGKCSLVLGALCPQVLHA
jgi:hypothetical protein